MSAVPNFAPFRQSHLGLHQTPPFDPGVGTQVLPDGWDEIPLWVPILASLPRLHNSPLAKCGCKKFCMDFHGARLDGECARAVVPHGRTRRAHTARSDGKRRPTARRRGDSELSSGSGREPELGLCPQHCPRQVCVKQPRAAKRFAATCSKTLTHPQDLDGPLRVAAQRKINAYGQQYADNQNISFLPAIATSTRMHGEFLRLLFLQVGLRRNSLPLLE